VRAFLGFEENGDGERLDIWTRDGALGWVFDNDVDEVSLGAPLVGFDMTAILEHQACPAVGAYLLHRIRDLMDGRRLAVICDECRFYLLNPLFSAMIEDFALTLRKKEGMLWLAAQQPEHITGSGIGASLISQCQTMFLFPSRTADPEQYIDKLGCTPAMFRAITEQMPTEKFRSVLIKRDCGSVIVKIELTGMYDEIAVLSGREATTRLIPAIREAVGDEPGRFVAEFLARYRATNKEALQ
jgi:type IV secretion system protein VirB4